MTDPTTEAGRGGAIIRELGWRAGFVAAALGGLGVRPFAPDVRGGGRRRLDR